MFRYTWNPSLLNRVYFDANLTVYFSTSSIDSTAYFDVLVPKRWEINRKKGAWSCVEQVWRQNIYVRDAALLSLNNIALIRSQHDRRINFIKSSACIGSKN